MQTTLSFHGTFWSAIGISLWRHLKCRNVIGQSNCLLTILGVFLAGIERSFFLILSNIGRPWNKMRTLFEGHSKVALLVKRGKNDRAARAARIFVHFSPVLVKTTTKNDQFFRFWRQRGQTTLIYLPTQIRFLIGGERVTCHWSKLHDALGRTKLHDALGQQQLELSTHTWSGRAPLKRRQICTPADVKQIIFICVLFYFELGGITKHLMTGPSGNSEFCFPSTSMFPSASPRGTLRVSGKQNSLFPLGPVIKCLVNNNLSFPLFASNPYIIRSTLTAIRTLNFGAGGLCTHSGSKICKHGGRLVYGFQSFWSFIA